MGRRRSLAGILVAVAMLLLGIVGTRFKTELLYWPSHAQGYHECKEECEGSFGFCVLVGNNQYELLHAPRWSWVGKDLILESIRMEDYEALKRRDHIAMQCCRCECGLLLRPPFLVSTTPESIARAWDDELLPSHVATLLRKRGW